MTEHQKYLNLIPSENWISEMKNCGRETLELYSNLPENQADFAYAEGKWSLKELLQHLIDAERIFVYRALRFSRKDKTALPGWDEEIYAKYYYPNEKTLASLIEEFQAVRKSTEVFFENLNSTQLSETGIANNIEVSVETLGKLVVGHNIHHLNIIEERYFQNFD